MFFVLRNRMIFPSPTSQNPIPSPPMSKPPRCPLLPERNTTEASSLRHESQKYQTLLRRGTKCHVGLSWPAKWLPVRQGNVTRPGRHYAAQREGRLRRRTRFPPSVGCLSSEDGRIALVQRHSRCWATMPARLCNGSLRPGQQARGQEGQQIGASEDEHASEKL